MATCQRATLMLLPLLLTVNINSVHNFLFLLTNKLLYLSWPFFIGHGIFTVFIISLLYISVKTTQKYSVINLLNLNQFSDLLAKVKS